MREGKTLELKRQFNDTVKKTIIAFANSDGGKVILGIEDDGAVVGIQDTDSVMLQVTNTVRDAIRPDVTLFTEVREEDREGKSVIVIEVLRGTARPYYLANKGLRPEGVFLRQASSTVPATNNAILSLIKETSGDSFEKSRSFEQDLTFQKSSQYFTEKGISFDSPQMKTLQLILQDGTFSNLGFLLSDQCIHTTKVAVFQGNNKLNFKDRREFSGSLLEQLEEVHSFIDRYNGLSANFQGLERIDQRDYPIAAVREALLNAFIHKDYSLSSSTLINLFDNRIEFVTIGGLNAGVGMDDILLGISSLRNPNLANVFYRLHLIEAYGTGLQKIFEAYEHSINRPIIEASNNAFKITLPKFYPDAGDSDLSERERKTLSLITAKQTIHRQDVEKELNVSQATAINLLREMVKKNLIVKTGSGKNTLYTVNNN